MHSAMEQTKYWMWTRRKFSERPPFNSPSPSIAGSSWEEQAFAEDSAAHLGGCVWPPRSYSCSFCRREFRSAQALGGHMNVHRRDRARLKQASSTCCDNHEAEHHHQLDPYMLQGTQYPDRVSTLAYRSNPNPNPTHGVMAPAMSPSRVSAAWTPKACSDGNLVSPLYPSSIIQGQVKEPIFSNPQSLADIIPRQPLSTSVLELKLGGENWRVRKVGCRGLRDLSDDEEIVSTKRRKTEATMHSLVNPSPNDKELLQAEVLKFKHTPVEELDLELRLGNPPKVKQPRG